MNIDIIDYIKENFAKYYIDRGPENGILQGYKYSGASTHARACLEALVKIRRPQNILEIGSWHYEGANAMAGAMDFIYGAGGGIVDSFDIRKGGYDGQQQFNPASPRINPRYWYAFHSEYDLWKYEVDLVYDFRQLTNEQIFEKNKQIVFEASKDFNNIYDLIFIDGDHSYEGVKKDFELAKLFSNFETLFVLDNIWDIRLKEVREFYDDLPYKKWDFESWNDEKYLSNQVQDTGIFTVA
jgi:hypothetical protein